MASAARQLRYHRGGSIYGDLAYDLDLELREHALRHAGEAPRKQEAVRQRPQIRRISKTQVRPRQKLSAFAAVGFMAVAALAVLLLMSYIQLTEISDDVVALKDELATLETENVSLTAEYAQMFDLGTVKEAAEAAGMGKPSSSQVYYVDLSEGDSAVIYQRDGESSVLGRLLTSLNHGIYAVVEYFE